MDTNVNNAIVGPGLFTPNDVSFPINNLNISNDMSSNIGEIAQALSTAQSELESAKKGQEGYGYNYSDLATVIQTAKPVLAKNGLAVTQLVSNVGDNPAVTTILVHKSGQFFKSFASMPNVEMKGCNVAQRMGATLSYLRRYAFQAILGMSSEDNDASSNGFSKGGKTSFSKPAAKTEAKPAAQKFRRKKKVENNDDDL